MEQPESESRCPLCSNAANLRGVRKPDGTWFTRVRCPPCGEYDISSELLVLLRTFPEKAAPYQARVKAALARGEKARLL